MIREFNSDNKNQTKLLEITVSTDEKRDAIVWKDLIMDMTLVGDLGLHSELVIFDSTDELKIKEIIEHTFILRYLAREIPK